jgi:hypothetical protein
MIIYTVYLKNNFVQDLSDQGGLHRKSIKKYINVKDLSVIIFSISILYIGSLQIFEGANNWLFYKYDDSEHLNIAYNFIHGNGLRSDTIDLEANSLEKNIPALQKAEEISSHLVGKNPLYFVFLGSWLYITGADYSNIFFYGSLFNLMLTALCIASFYFFVKKYFGFEIALLATPLLASIPALVWFSVRIRPDILLFLLVIITLYFAGKKATNFNVIGSAIFVALAHFTHPLAILLGVAVLVSYLLRKKLKASILFVSTWIIIMIPWLIRNYLMFEDPIRGFGMPIPRELLIAFGIVAPDSKVLDVYPAEFHRVSLIDTLQGMINNFSNVYGMEYFLIFVSLSLIAFVSFKALRIGPNNIFRNKIPFVIGLVFYSLGIYLITSGHVFVNNLIVQSLFMFVIPLSMVLFIKLFTSHKKIFTANNNIYIVIGLYAIINLLMYFIYPQISGRIVPEIRIIIIAFYTLIPLSIIGLKKILGVIFSFVKVTYRSRIIFASMCIILFSFAFYQAITGINIIDSRFERLAGEAHHFNMNAWIRENIPPNSKTASDMPHALTLQTGLPSVNFQHGYKDNASYEKWIIKKFDIDYLIFYFPKDDLSGLSILDLGDINLEKIYQDPEGAFVYRVYQD